jgi:hypothetical protein
MTDMSMCWWDYVPWTSQEEAYLKLRCEAWNTWSEAARTLLGKVESAAWNEFMEYYPLGEYEEPSRCGEITDDIRVAAAGLSVGDLELFEELAQAAFRAAASISPKWNDRGWAEDRAYEPNPHDHYRLLCGLLWVIWVEGVIERRRQAEAHE